MGEWVTGLFVVPNPWRPAAVGVSRILRRVVAGACLGVVGVVVERVVVQGCVWQLVFLDVVVLGLWGVSGSGGWGRSIFDAVF